VSLVGPSGCGKSTLLDPRRPAGAERRRVLLDGREPDELLGRVGYMPQDDLLMAWRTTLDNVTLGLELAGVPRAEARAARASRARSLRFRGLRAPLAARAVRRDAPAGGAAADVPRRARGAAARRAVRRARCADARGDARVAARVWEADRKTILLVTHDVEEAVFLSDRVYVMSSRPGRIRAARRRPAAAPRARRS
jgi:ABC-type nitrate/sulfonate/bicarbonate transport system ATPase subunit